MLLSEGLGLPVLGEGFVSRVEDRCLSFKHLCTVSSAAFHSPPVSSLLSLRFFKSLFHMKLIYPFQVVFLIFCLFFFLLVGWFW